MPSADNSDTSAATAGSATLGDENGNDSHIRADRRASANRASTTAVTPRDGRSVPIAQRRRHGRDRRAPAPPPPRPPPPLPPPARVEARRTSERSRRRRRPGPKNIDDAAPALPPRPDERSLTLHTPFDRRSGEMRPTPAARVPQRTPVTPRHRAAVLAPEVHQGLVPTARVVRVDPAIREGVDSPPRWLGIAEPDAPHDPANVHVDRGHTDAARDRGDGRGRVRADAGQRP